MVLFGSILCLAVLLCYACFFNCPSLKMFCLIANGISIFSWDVFKLGVANLAAFCIFQLSSTASSVSNGHFKDKVFPVPVRSFDMQEGMTSFVRKQNREVNRHYYCCPSPSKILPYIFMILFLSERQYVLCLLRSVLNYLQTLCLPLNWHIRYLAL